MRHHEEIDPPKEGDDLHMRAAGSINGIRGVQCRDIGKTHPLNSCFATASGSTSPMSGQRHAALAARCSCEVVAPSPLSRATNA